VPRRPGHPRARRVVVTLSAVLVATTTALSALGTLCAGALGASAPPVAGAGAGAPTVPRTWLPRFLAAAATCPGLPWEVLAAIGAVESDDGRSDAPGVWSGANPAGAEGPMQFEPATFARYALPVPRGGAEPPSPYDPTDAITAAARDLCANGARDGADLPAAVLAYNHSRRYVAEVLALARSYAGTTGAGTTGAGTVPAGVSLGSGAPPTGRASVAVAWALAQLGTPSVWGGATPGVGFDCSGLVQAAERVAGVALPRVAQAQFDAGPRVPPGTPLVPGDLVFFGLGPGRVEHVGLVVGPGVMVDAPHAGAVVRIDAFPTTLGAPWGDEVLVGATRP
jgi:cell wall-associated NlpC family hydrolase